MLHAPLPRPTTHAGALLLRHRRDVHAPPRRSVCPEVHASGARAQAGPNIPGPPPISCRTLHYRVNGASKFAPLAVPLGQRAVTHSRELVNPSAATVDLGPPAGQQAGAL